MKLAAASSPWPSPSPALAGCYPIQASRARPDRIEFVGSSVVDGYKFDQYRNLAYPCSISGYQTFVIGTKVGSSDTETRPLWVRMRGGGVGFFDSAGNPQPSAGNKSEESAATSIRFVTGARADAAGARATPPAFRLVSVSMCNHDIYAGGDQPDPNNPNTLPDGIRPHGQRPVRDQGGDPVRAGAVPDRQDLPARDERRLGGGAVGGLVGLEEQGIPPAGAVADSGVVNLEWERAQCRAGHRAPDAGTAARRRSPRSGRARSTSSPTSRTSRTSSSAAVS